MVYLWTLLESNQGHPDLQSGALPSELRVRCGAGLGFEPITMRNLYFNSLYFRVRHRVLGFAYPPVYLPFYYPTICGDAGIRTPVQSNFQYTSFTSLG